MSDPFTDWQVVQKYKVCCSQRSEGMHFYLIIIHTRYFRSVFSMCLHSHVVSRVRYNSGYCLLFLFLFAILQTFQLSPKWKVLNRDNFFSQFSTLNYGKSSGLGSFFFQPWTVELSEMQPNGPLFPQIILTFDWRPQCHVAATPSDTILFLCFSQFFLWKISIETI